MMKMKLIINADDFGLTKGVNAAILELAQLRAISSTTVMVNMPFAEEASKLVDFPDCSIGLHFNLTEGKPVADAGSVASLVGPDGFFFPQAEFRKRLARGKVLEDHMREEMKAQFDVLHDRVGDRLTHIDSHQNIHKAWLVARVLLRFADGHPGLGIRAPARFLLIRGRVVPSMGQSLQRFKIRQGVSEFYLHYLTRRLEAKFWTPIGELHAPSLRKLDLLKTLSEPGFSLKGETRIFEIACHPATNMEGLGGSNLGEKRIQEYEIMRGDAFAQTIQGIELVSFGGALRTVRESDGFGRSAIS